MLVFQRQLFDEHPSPVGLSPGPDRWVGGQVRRDREGLFLPPSLPSSLRPDRLRVADGNSHSVKVPLPICTHHCLPFLVASSRNGLRPVCRSCVYVIAWLVGCARVRALLAARHPGTPAGVPSQGPRGGHAVVTSASDPASSHCGLDSSYVSGDCVWPPTAGCDSCCLEQPPFRSDAQGFRLLRA